MRKRIIILGASKLQVPAIVEAKKMGLETVVVDKNPDAPGFAIADVRILESTRDTDKIMKAALELHVSGIMTMATDLPMRVVASVASAIGLPGISEENVMKATDKGLMRKCLKEAGLPCPNYFRVNTYEELSEAARKLNYDCVIKPADSSGSRGVFRITKALDLDGAYQTAKEYSFCGDIIVEEYIKGYEISVEAITSRGTTYIAAITDKITTGTPRFVEIGHSQPSRLPQETLKKVENIVLKTITAIGINDGASHTELKLDMNGPKIIEIGARLGGDFIASHLVPLSTGINIVNEAIKIAIGREIHVERIWNKGASIKYFVAPPGLLAKIQGYEEVKQMPGIVELEVYKNIGERIGEVCNSTDRLGHVIVSADNAKDSLKLCEEAVSKLMFEIEN